MNVIICSEIIFYCLIKKSFLHQSSHCNILFLLSDKNVLCVLFGVYYLQLIKQKSLFTPWKLGSIMQLLRPCVVFFNWYLFQLIVRLNPNFNCCSNFVLSWVDKVTTETYSLYQLLQKLFVYSLKKLHNLLTELK